MNSIKLFLPVLAIPFFQFFCGGGGGTPPPPTGPDAIEIEVSGQKCCAPCSGCESQTWQARNLRGDVGATVCLQEQWNAFTEGPYPSWQNTSRAPFILNFAPAQTVSIPNSMCSLRQQGPWCAYNFRYVKIAGCTFDQSNCIQPQLDSNIITADCIKSFDFSNFTPDEQLAIAELYNVIKKSAFRNYNFKYGLHEMFGTCSKDSSFTYRDTLDVMGSTCSIPITLLGDVDVKMTTGGDDRYNFLSITAPNIIRGEIKRTPAAGTLTLFSNTGFSYIFNVFFKVRQVYQFDILRTIEARGSNLYFKGDFVCFAITEIDANFPEKKKPGKVVKKEK